MTKVWKANEWLLNEGHIEKITRGRRSTINIQRLTEAAQAGVKFSDFEPVESTNASGEKVIKNSRTTAQTSNIENYNEPFIRYEGGDERWTVLDESGNKRTLREACMNCHYSLVGHTCDSPRIVTLSGDPNGTAVTITLK